MILNPNPDLCQTNGPHGIDTELKLLGMPYGRVAVTALSMLNERNDEVCIRNILTPLDSFSLANVCLSNLRTGQLQELVYFSSACSRNII